MQTFLPSARILPRIALRCGGLSKARRTAVSASQSRAEPEGSVMEYRYLGRTGLQVSALGFGTANFKLQIQYEEVREILKALYDSGVNFFDGAETYGGGEAEGMLGRAIKEFGWARSSLVISTKLLPRSHPIEMGANAKGLHRKHIIEGTRAALQRMQLDYVDLVYCHRADETVTIEETVRAMNHIINQGWAFYWGTSEWPAQRIEQAIAVADRLGLIGPSMEEPQYNLFERQKVENEYLSLFENYGLGATTWSPLAMSSLSGKYLGGGGEGGRLKADIYTKSSPEMVETYAAPERMEKIAKLGPVAEKLGCSLSQLAIAWCLANPHVSSVLTGASQVAQVHDNMEALSVVKRLTPEVLQELDDIIGSKPAPPPKFR